jgi:antitoxin MazE
MTNAILSIKQWGNSLGVRLPAAIAREAHLQCDQQVCVEVKDGQVIVTAVREVPMTLEQRLEKFDSLRHGGEVMISERVGAERW